MRFDIGDAIEPLMRAMHEHNQKLEEQLLFRRSAARQLRGEHVYRGCPGPGTWFLAENWHAYRKGLKP